MDQLYRCFDVRTLAAVPWVLTHRKFGRREEKIDDARSTFQNIAGRKLDWPEMVFDAWSSFERLHGSLDQIQACLDRIEREQANVDSRRAREAERASQGAYQTSQQMSDASNLISQAVAEVSEPQDEEVPMEVEQQANETTKKRKLEGEDTDTTAKKAKPGTQMLYHLAFVLILHDCRQCCTSQARSRKQHRFCLRLASDCHRG